MAKNVLVKNLYDSVKDPLKLKLSTPGNFFNKRINSTEVHRPGLALAGFFDYFSSDRVQILGRTEVSYIKMQKSNKDFEKRLKKFFSYKMPCIIVAKNLKVAPVFLEYARRYKVPIFRSPLKTTTLVSKITLYIEDALAPKTHVHGTLLDVYGVGTLLLGKSGAGKSETALELVQRGQRLVADDNVEVKLTPGDVLIGFSSQVIRHHMEIRGLGIIDMMSLFGVGAVRNQKRILLAVTLEHWDKNVEYERVGLADKTIDILGVSLPHLVIPVIPGRNIPVLVEVAALNQRLNRMGIKSAERFNEDLIKQIAEGNASD